jgi:methyl-accepting chemotaxis protein
MIWKNLSISKKLGVGFGFVLLFTAILAFISFSGIGHIVLNAGEVIDGNKIRGNIISAEVAHLNWAKKVSTFLAEHNGDLLQVQLDDHLCAFGKWLNGAERKQAEAMIPSLAPHLAEIEKFHHDLHASAVDIKKYYEPADPSLPAFLAEREIDHLKFITKIQNVLLNHDAVIEGQTDPHKCNLGKWLYGEEARKVATLHPELEPLIEAVIAPHARLHESVTDLQNSWNPDDPAARLQTREIFAQVTLPALKEVSHGLEAMGKCAIAELAGLEKANHIYTSQTIPALQYVQNELSSLKNEIDTHMMTDTVMLNSASRTRQKVLGIALAAILAGVAISILITRAITRPLVQATAFAGKVADGDLTARVTTSLNNDETGKLIQSLNAMAGNLGQVMGDISQNSNQVAAASEELSATSQQMAAGAEEMTSQAGTVAAAAEEIGVNMNTVSTTASMMNEKSDDIASSAQEMSENINSVAAAIEEMTASIGEVAQNSSSASNLAGRANELSSISSEEMKKLDQAAKDIGNVINLITEITEQTKLLSLNATIEAARAGEAGKGFAVVANEVKDLAGQTSEATGEIVGRIQAMQSQTTSVVANINKMSEVNRQVNEINTSIAAAIEEQSATTNEIARTVNETSASVSIVAENIQELSTNIEQEILGSVNEAVTGVQDVSANIQGVSTVSRDTAQGATAINQASTELASLATQLQGQVEKFRLN